MPTIPRRQFAALVVSVPLGLATPAVADPVCAPGGTWAYTGTAHGSATVREGAKFTLLEFSPSGGATADSAVVFSASSLLPPGIYQVNGDVEVAHLSDEAKIVLAGAGSAAPGRDFDVTMAAGDGGSSSFSRPIAVTGEAFAIQIRMKASGRVSLKMRNFNICKLR